MAVSNLSVMLPTLGFVCASDWEAWLAEQPRSTPGVWLKLAKKGSGVASVSRQEAIDAALCHGWIDGQLQKFDERHWLIRFTPRKSKSKWSEINCRRAMELIAEGRMRAAGLEELERAKADGRWAAAYAPQSTAVAPADLQAALDANPAARRAFSELDSVNRYAIIYRLGAATKPAIRATKLEKYIQMLLRGDRIHPAKKRAD